MLKRLYLFVISTLCSVSALALDLNTVSSTGVEFFVIDAPKDTVPVRRHSLFHSIFGDDVEYPTLTGNAAEDAETLGGFFNTIASRRNVKIETFFSLLPLAPKDGKGSTLETLNKILPATYRCFYSATMEYLLFYEMGGKNRTIAQVFNAIRGDMNSKFTPLTYNYPDLYCAQLDSVKSFVKNLDYIGDIYPEMEGIKPREKQDSIAAKVCDAVELMKVSLRKNAERVKVFRELMTGLYEEPATVDLRKYFTDDVCEQIAANKLSLKSISPEKTWENWNAENGDLCTFSYDSGDTYTVILSNKRIDERLDADNSRSVHSFSVTYTLENGRWLINEVKVQDVLR